MGEEHQLVRGKGPQGVLDGLKGLGLAGVAQRVDPALLETLDGLRRDVLGALDGIVHVREQEARPGGQRRRHHHDLGALRDVLSDGAGQRLVGDGL